jgi:hypothetical protein
MPAWGAIATSYSITSVVTLKADKTPIGVGLLSQPSLYPLPACGEGWGGARSLIGVPLRLLPSGLSALGRNSRPGFLGGDDPPLDGWTGMVPTYWGTNPPGGTTVSDDPNLDHLPLDELARRATSPSTARTPQTRLGQMGGTDSSSLETAIATFKKYIPEIIAFISLEAFGSPFFHAGADAMVNGHVERGIYAYIVGGISALAGVTFHWWKRWRFWGQIKRFVAPLWPAPILLLFVYIVGPEMYRRAIAINPSADEIAAAVVRALPKNVSGSSFGSAEATQSVHVPRSKQTINDLLAESGQLQVLIENTAVPLGEEWRRLLDRNPEEVCLDLDAEAYRAKLIAEREKFRAAHEALVTIMNQNQIDQNELAPLIGGIGSYQNTGFILGMSSLDTFTRDFDLIRNLNSAAATNSKPSCEIVIRSNRAPHMFINMDRGWGSFAQWLMSSSEKIKKYRSDLRLESRNAH